MLCKCFKKTIKNKQEGKKKKLEETSDNGKAIMW